MSETPRRADSLSDLRVGQLVAYVPDDSLQHPSDSLIHGIVKEVDESRAIVGEGRYSAYDGECKDGEWIILMETPEPVSVPRDVYERLRKAIHRDAPITSKADETVLAALALVVAVEEE